MAPPDRSVPLAATLLPPDLSSHGVRLVWLAAPHRASRVLQLLIPPRPLLGTQVRGVVPQAPLKHGNAGGTSTAAGCDAPPNVRCGSRFSVKHPRPRAMWACCADSSSDDDDHSTSNTLLLLFADAFVAPALLVDFSEVDELTVALSCHFALDIFTIAQQDRPRPPWMRPVVLRHGPRLGFQATARVDVCLCRLPSPPLWVF